MQFFEGDENFSWRVLAIESLVIMLSVLLGFMLNGWRTSQGEQETVDAALQSIAAEVRYNKRELEQHLPYYRSMRDTLAYLASVRREDTAIETSEIPGFRGYDIPVLRPSAFETARSTGVLSDMEFELADALFSTYRIQTLYTGLLEKLTTGFIMGNFETIENWWMVFALMANNGGFAHESYPELLELLSEKYDIEVPEAESADTTRAAR